MIVPPPSDPPLTLSLFGPFQASLEGEPLARLRSRKGHCLLALLALRQGRQVEREWLMAVLWPENPTHLAAHSLRNSLADLRKALGSEAHRLSAPTPRTLMLDLTGACVDVLAFDAAIADGSPEALEQATALARAPLLEGWTEEWAFQERQAGELAVFGALETLTRRAVEAGNLAAAERYLRLAITREPLWERCHRALMQVLREGGNAAAALTVYHEFRLRLHREANGEPDPETRALFEQIRASARRPHPASGAPPRKPRPTGLSHNLPHPLTSFIGREPQMAEVKRLLSTTRLVTLTGAGGCGKTRLALQVATDLLPTVADGVWLVELAPLTDPALVAQAVAVALRVREKPGCSLTQTLAEWLEPRHLLLVLDNCEHLVEACAHLAEALLRACSNLRVLATSREPLGVGGETPFRVPSLSLPDPQHPLTRECLTRYGATRLFVERATTVLPSFLVTDVNAATVVQICRRLDGIPLAIELAAVWVNALPVEQIAARLADRFRLLTGGIRTAAPRHQTLRSLIDWSYALLTEAERLLLRRLAVFAGGWTLAAAEAVCGGGGIEASEVLHVVARLVEKSLAVYEEPREAGGAEGAPWGPDPGRYRLLETVRQYAWDRLQEAGEAEAVRGRHCDWYLALAEEAEPGLLGESQRAWLDRLEREHDNLRAALDWCRFEASRQRAEDRPDRSADRQGNPEHDVRLPTGGEAGLRLGGALWQFWIMRGYLVEAREHLTGLLVLPGAEARTAARAKVLYAAGRLARSMGDYGEARPLLEESLAVYRELGDKDGIAWPLAVQATSARGQGDYVTARALSEESLAIFREVGNKHGVAWSLIGLGRAACDMGDYEEARAPLEESLALYRELGDKEGIAWTLNTLGWAARDQGDCVAARAFLEESMAIFRELGNEAGIAWALPALGWAARDQGDCVAARALFEESLAFYREQGDKEAIVKNLEGLAAVAVTEAQPERAARLYGAVEGLRKVIGAPLGPADRAEHDPFVAAVRATLGEEAFAAAWEAGRALSLDDAVALALDETQEG